LGVNFGEVDFWGELKKLKELKELKTIVSRIVIISRSES